MSKAILKWTLKHPILTVVLSLAGLGGTVELGKGAIKAIEHIGCAAANAVGTTGASIGTAAVALTNKAIDSQYGIHVTDDGFSFGPQQTIYMDNVN